MSDFGASLRQARERRGITLRQIESRTKIALASLEALERNEAAKLPGGIFARAIVRAYADEVGLDPEATVREFISRLEVDAAPSSEPAEPSTDGAPAARPLVLITVLVAGIVLVAVLLFLTLRRPAAESKSPTPDAHPPAAAAAAQS